MLKNIGPQQWIFNELKLIGDTAFRFASDQSAVDTVEELSEAMQFYPPQDFITGSDLFYEYHAEVCEINFKKEIIYSSFLNRTSKQS